MSGAERTDRNRKQQANRARAGARQGASGAGASGKDAPQDSTPGAFGNARRGAQASAAARAKPQTRDGRKAANAVAAARGASGGSRTPVIAAVAVVVVLVAAVVVGVVLAKHRTTQAAAAGIPVVKVTGGYPVTVGTGGDAAVVIAGQSTAKVTVDSYEDFLCPVCGQFEGRDSGAMEKALEAGQIKVRYHPLNLLDSRSNPQGYSMLSANAGLCAAEAGGWPSFHASLYGKQPEEGGTGYTADQLVQLGKDTGAGGSYEQCTRSGTHNAQVQKSLETAEANPALQQPAQGGGTSFGTPTVLVNGKIVDWGTSGDWLPNAIKAAG